MTYKVSSGTLSLYLFIHLFTRMPVACLANRHKSRSPQFRMMQHSDPRFSSHARPSQELRVDDGKGNLGKHCFATQRRRSLRGQLSLAS